MSCSANTRNSTDCRRAQSLQPEVTGSNPDWFTHCLFLDNSQGPDLLQHLENGNSDPSYLRGCQEIKLIKRINHVKLFPGCSRVQDGPLRCEWKLRHHRQAFCISGGQLRGRVYCRETKVLLWGTSVLSVGPGYMKLWGLWAGWFVFYTYYGAE